MRILFIEPPFYTLMNFRGYGFPVGLAMMAAVLEERGHDVKVLDADRTGEAPRTNPEFLEAFSGEYMAVVNDENHRVWKELEAKIAKFQPDLVGIGIMTPKVASAIRVAEAAKRAVPGACVIVGGAHPTMRGEEILEASPAIDAAIRGDGFSLLQQITDTLEAGKPLPRIMDGNADQVDFNGLPMPARHLLDTWEDYKSEELGLMVTTMGCPWRCTFCSTHTVWNKKRASRTAQRVVDEFLFVHKEYGIRNFNVLDDVFTLERDKVMEICDKLIAADLPITWTCATHVNIVDDELVARMKESGCIRVAVGVETGSPRMMKLIKKGLSEQRLAEAKRVFEQNGMNWTGFFMIGLLNEHKEDMFETLNVMRNLDPPFSSLGVYTNLPGTPMFELGLELGITEPHMTREDYFKRPWSRYYFKDAQRKIDGLSTEDYEKVVERIMRDFHKHNHSGWSLVRRAWRKRHDYMQSPKHLWMDLRRLPGKLRVKDDAQHAALTPTTSPTG